MAACITKQIAISGGYVCRMFTVRVVAQDCLCVCGHGGPCVDFVVYLCIECGLRAKDSIGLPETMDCECPVLVQTIVRKIIRNSIARRVIFVVRILSLLYSLILYM
jgi:hypothetical protein